MAVRKRVREAERRKKAEAKARKKRRRGAEKPARRKSRVPGKAAADRMPPVQLPNRPVHSDEPFRLNPLLQTFQPAASATEKSGPFAVGPVDRRQEAAASADKRPARSRRTLNRRGRLALVLILAAVCAILVWMAPWFRIHRIRVAGQAYMDDRVVETASGLSVGTHALQMISGSVGQLVQGRSDAAERAVLRTLPNVQSVTARFVIPSEVLLTVELKPASAYIQSGSRYWLIDDAGYAAAELMPGDALPAGVRYLMPPVTDGRTLEWPSELAIGSRLGPAAAETLSRCGRLRELLAELDAAVSDGLSLQDDILSVQLSDQNLIFALNLSGEPDVSDAAAEVLQAVRIQVNPDRVDCWEQLRWLRYALRSGQFNDLGAGVLDLSGRQRVFRPQALLDQLVSEAIRPSETLPPSPGSGAEQPGASDETAVSDPPESEPSDGSAVTAVLPMN